MVSISQLASLLYPLVWRVEWRGLETADYLTARLVNQSMNQRIAKPLNYIGGYS